MKKYVAKPTRALRWMHNNAPRITSLLEQKESWYDQFNESFWINWERDVFNIDTANPFGLSLWCNILGVPTRLFNFDSRDKAFAFGKERENFESSNPGAAIENLLLFSTCSTKNGYAVTGSGGTIQFVTGPDGENDAIYFVSGTSGGVTTPSAQVEVNKPYNVSFYAKNDEAEEFIIAVSLGYNGTTIPSKNVTIPANTGWARYSIDVTTQTTLSDKIIRLYKTTPGKKIFFAKLQVNSGTGAKPYTATSGNALTAATGSTGGNFAGAGSGLTDIDDVRTMLKLRYITLIGNGRTSFVNRMLNYIFNKGKPWNIPNKEYAYVVDKTCNGLEVSAKIIVDRFEGLVEYPQNRKRIQYFAQNAKGVGMVNAAVNPAAEMVNNVLAPDNTMTMLDFSMKAGTTGVRRFSVNTAGTLAKEPSTNSISFYVKRTGKTYITKFRCDLSNVINGIEKPVSSSVFTLTGNGAVTSDSAATIESRVNAYGSAYFIGISIPNEPDVGRIIMRLTMLNNNGDESTGAATDISGIGLWGFMCEQTYRPGIFLYNDTTAPQEYAPVVIDNETGNFTLPQAPKSNDTLYWTGRWKFGGANKQLIGGGDGTKVNWTLTTPTGGGAAITKDFYSEIRLGANVKISAQFIALLNDRSNGLIPQNTGSSYLVVKET